MPRIGSYTLHTIETGSFGLDGGAMFGVVPKPLWEKRLSADDRNRIPLAMRCLLLESTTRLVLVDNGLGHKYNEKFADLYAVNHERYTLQRSLAKAGFGAEDVTDVILTHLHFDHAGGSTVRRGDRLEIVFKNARHFVQRSQWETAKAPNPRERPSFLAENLDPLEASGQLELLDGPGELLPGVSTLLANGHSSGMQLVKVADEARTIVFAADLLPTSHHLGQAWTMAYDVRPLESMSEKAIFLADAVAAGWNLFFEHDPNVAVASLEQTEKGVRTVHPRPLDEL